VQAVRAHAQHGGRPEGRRGDARPGHSRPAASRRGELRSSAFSGGICEHGRYRFSGAKSSVIPSPLLLPPPLLPVPSVASDFQMACMRCRCRLAANDSRISAAYTSKQPANWILKGWRCGGSRCSCRRRRRSSSPLCVCVRPLLAQSVPLSPAASRRALQSRAWTGNSLSSPP